jgi:hypothetical protein
VECATTARGISGIAFGYWPRCMPTAWLCNMHAVISAAESYRSKRIYSSPIRLKLNDQPGASLYHWRSPALGAGAVILKPRCGFNGRPACGLRRYSNGFRLLAGYTKPQLSAQVRRGIFRLGSARVPRVTAHVICVCFRPLLCNGLRKITWWYAC